MKEYDHRKIEPKIQKYWGNKKVFRAKDGKQKKFYGLIEFPYPSGDGLHVGHIRSNTAMDIISRKRRMEGFNVLYPIGYDAFGLPTENYAIKTGKKPALVTKKNTDTFRKQLKAIGFSFDWSREINTTDPKYYKWTQWIFLKFFEKGLAYKAKSYINWCPSCKIGLANEEAQGGVCERCGSNTEKREKEQWMLAITKYADRLDKDLDEVDFLDRIKISQRNWIGRSEGSEIDFKIFGDVRHLRSAGVEHLAQVKVFTTRPDTIYGATYLVLAPEHELITKLQSKITNWSEVEKYVKEVKNKTETERTNNEKIKTGVEVVGLKAINPATKKEIPIWIADYVLSTYGTGAIMAVPADDKRDREFAEKFNLPIVENYEKAGLEDFGKKVTTFKLRDWVFSRQRYWGEPIPIISCEKCGLVPVPFKDLPVKLPEVKSYKPTENGESPLASIKKWINVKCPKCKGVAKRETDTMPNWAGSSWYYLRYIDPKNSKEFANKKSLKYWLNVDWYNGGMEHTTLHLLYSRFWHKFLYDLELVPTKEPYNKRTSHGMILGEGGVKMSKSLGNVINPDDIVKIYGADTLRIYEMFIGPFEDSVAWSTDSIIGSRRFVEKVWRIASQLEKNFVAPPASGFPHEQNSSQAVLLKKLLHKTIKKVSEDIENMRFNTAISSMMVLANEMESAISKGYNITKEDFKKFLQILSPFAPHIAEELWFSVGEKKTIVFSSWPKWDEKMIKDEEVRIAIQINGKVRAELLINVDDEENDVKKKAFANDTVMKYLEGKEVKRFFYVKNRLINIVL
jgi:leucyl-tRNA synthetase